MSRPLPKWLILVLQTILGAITVSVLLITVFVTMPVLETRFFPVVHKLLIDSIEPLGNQSIVRGTFNKVRQCDYIGIAWFERNQLGGLDRVQVQTRRDINDVSSPNRPVGWQSAGPWIIAIPADELKSNSVAELSHRCHPFWTTVTHFYP